MPRLTKLVLGFITALLCGSLFAANTQPTIQSFNKMPLAFTKNMGQWDDRVLFRANAGGATMWFTKEGVSYQFTRHIDTRSGAVSAPGVSVGRTFLSDPGQAGMPIPPGDRYEKDSVEQLVLTAKFVGANPNPEVIAEGQLEYKCNYFLGNEPSKWHTDVPNYEAITLKDIYPGVDLKYSGDGNGQAAYEFIAAPGADIAQIKVAYEGAEETSIDGDGRMVVTTKWGDMIAAIKSPTNGVLSGTASFSQLSEKTIGFEANGASHQALGTSAVELVYSTYLGGGDLDQGSDIAVDGSGNAYVTGLTMSSNFPTLNPYQTDQGNWDVFVTKLSSSGNSLIYSTYLGGESNDFGSRIAIDGSGNAYVTGETESSNFPTLNPYQTDQGGGDVFVTKLNSTGSSLIYSTYLGGGDDDGGNGIAVDGSGNAYVTGFTYSPDFPTLNPYQTDQGGTDAFVTKLSSSGNSLIYSTYLGGFGWDAGYGIAVDGSGNAYVTGETGSSNFPTLNPYQTYQGPSGYEDAFVTKLSSTGNTLIYSTYLGGEDEDGGYGIAVDGSGNAYVTGRTYSSNFPTQNPYQSTNHGYYDVFVTKLSGAGNVLIYSTYLGGGHYDEGYGIAVDGSGNAYVMGHTQSSDFPTLNPYQATFQGGYADAFVTKLSSFGNSPIYGTYLGGAGEDLGSGIAVDGNGNAYVTGITASDDFPTLNPYQTYPGSSCNYNAFVTKLSGPYFCQEFAGLFCDDFDDMSSPLWSQTEGSCVWLTTGGVFQTSLVGMQLSCVQSVGDTTWRNYSFEADVRGNEGTDKVIRFRQRNANTRYWVNLRSDWQGQDELLLGKQAGGIETILQTVPYVSQNGVWYHLKITCVENHMRVSVNGNEIIVFDDVSDPIRYGGIGLVCFTGGFGSCDISFDNVRVSGLVSGDADNSGAVDISDAVFCISYIFSGGAAPDPLPLGDANCDGMVDISDAVYLIAYIFAGGSAPCSAP